MNLISENPSKKLIWGSLGTNILICFTLLPLALQPGSSYTARQLIETLFWQGLSLFSWPIAVVVGIISFVLQGSGPDLGTILSIGIYPLLWLAVLFIIYLKKKWIPFLALHLLITLSFAAVWLPVLYGYDFMVG
ncbi:MAG: hypothetical protein MUP11_10090 [Anaerolineales bacterium]|nr:hypothetical protein [Anaerolineales bacterium]